MKIKDMIQVIKLKKYKEYYFNAVEGSRENCVSSTNEGLGQFQDTAPVSEV